MIDSSNYGWEISTTRCIRSIEVCLASGRSVRLTPLYKGTVVPCLLVMFSHPCWARKSMNHSKERARKRACVKYILRRMQDCIYRVYVVLSQAKSAQLTGWINKSPLTTSTSHMREETAVAYRYALQMRILPSRTLEPAKNKRRST